MHKIINASFPRSGHHMMKDVLQHYFGDEMKYCKWSDEPDKRPDFCEETNFTMIHDLTLTYYRKLYGHKFLVLVRHPIYSLASWRIHMKRPEGDICEDIEITQQKLEFWSKWMNRWVLTELPERLIVQYESMISHPFSVFEKIVKFCSDEPVDVFKLQRCITVVAPTLIPNTTNKWIGWI